MYLDSLSKEKLYFSLANILSADINIIKKYIIENAGIIVDNHYDEWSIESIDLDKLFRVCGCRELNLINDIIVNHIILRRNTRPMMETSM